MLSLFDDQPQPEEAPSTPVMMSESQRAAIRTLFQALGITSAREQFDHVAEMTGKRIAAVGELDARTANTLISLMKSRVDSLGRNNTGNSWDDRQEDTWIDRL